MGFHKIISILLGMIGNTPGPGRAPLVTTVGHHTDLTYLYNLSLDNK